MRRDLFRQAMRLTYAILAFLDHYLTRQEALELSFGDRARRADLTGRDRPVGAKDGVIRTRTRPRGVTRRLVG